MARKELTPAELTFQSFRHSQGNLGLQLGIFRFFDLKYGIKPDLHPSSEEVSRYVGFLCDRSNKTHIQYDETGSHSAEKKVYASTKSLRELYHEKRDKPFRKMGLPRTVATLTNNMWAQEIKILSIAQPWVSNDNGKQRGHEERIKTRIASGKSSFLYYYGRDGHSTGIEGFDEMYRTVWDYNLLFINGRLQDETHKKHADAVLDAERAYLGRVVLAQPPK